MRISWREVLGLLVGLAICYGVITYALTNAPQNRETASERSEASSEHGRAKQQTTPASPSGTPPPTPPSASGVVTVRVTGYGGEPFSGTLGTTDSSHQVSGTALTDYELQSPSGSPSATSVFATIYKTAGDDNVLTVQILEDGKVVKGESTTAPYGGVSLTWSPEDGSR